MKLNKELLNNPEVREIAEAYANANKLPSVLCDWGTFVAKQTRKLVFLTCKEDGEQEVFEGGDYYYIWNDTIRHVVNVRHIPTCNSPTFKNPKNAENYLCENYRFTVKELVGVYGTEFIGAITDSFKTFLYNEAKKRLGI